MFQIKKNYQKQQQQEKREKISKMYRQEDRMKRMNSIHFVHTIGFAFYGNIVSVHVYNISKIENLQSNGTALYFILFLLYIYVCAICRHRIAEAALLKNIYIF